MPREELILNTGDKNQALRWIIEAARGTWKGSGLMPVLTQEDDEISIMMVLIPKEHIPLPFDDTLVKSNDTALLHAIGYQPEGKTDKIYGYWDKGNFHWCTTTESTTNKNGELTFRLVSLDNPDNYLAVTAIEDNTKKETRTRVYVEPSTKEANKLLPCLNSIPGMIKKERN